MMAERRKHARFLPNENAFAALGENYIKVGKIKNISAEGLSFEYIAGEEVHIDSKKVDVFVIGNLFHLHNLPCKIIYDVDYHVPHVNNAYVKIRTAHRRGTNAAAAFY